MRTYAGGFDILQAEEEFDLDVPALVITDALLQRLGSSVEDAHVYKLLAATPDQFGEHDMKEAQQ